MYVCHALYQLIPHPHLYLCVPPTYCISSTLSFWYSCPKAFYSPFMYHLLSDSHGILRLTSQSPVKVEIRHPAVYCSSRCLSRNARKNDGHACYFAEAPSFLAPRSPLTAKACQPVTSVWNISSPSVLRSPLRSC